MADGIPELDQIVEERLAKEMPKPDVPETNAPTGPDIDPNRLELLKYVDSPFLNRNDAEITIGDVSQALYILSFGPMVMKPLLAGNKAEFEMMALIFYEEQAKGKNLQEMSIGLANWIGGDYTDEAQKPAMTQVDKDKEADIILGAMKENPELIKKLRDEAKGKKKKGKQ